MTGREGEAEARSAAGTQALPLSVADLEKAVREKEPAVCFVLPRVLRRVVKQHAIPGPGRQGAASQELRHRSRATAGNRGALGVGTGRRRRAAGAGDPAAQPSPESLASMTAGKALLGLLAALVPRPGSRGHAGTRGCRAAVGGRDPPADSADRTHRVRGDPDWFCDQEDLLLRPRDDATV